MLTFHQNISLQVGNGAKIRFWEDVCIKNEALKVKFARLYKISSQKKELIVNMGWYEGENWRWTLSWKMRLQPEDNQDEELLSNILQLHYPRTQQSDQIQWSTCSNYSVKSLVRKTID